MLLVGLIFCIGTTIAEEVTIDIKPDTVYNTINLDSNGLLPVAILGADGFDVTDINTSTLRFGTDIDDDNSSEPIRLSYNDTNGDGLLDLIMKFEIVDLAALPGLNLLINDGECVDLSVFGTTNDDVIFSGEDCVYKPENLMNILP